MEKETHDLLKIVALMVLSVTVSILTAYYVVYPIIEHYSVKQTPIKSIVVDNNKYKGNQITVNNIVIKNEKYQVNNRGSKKYNYKEIDEKPVYRKVTVQIENGDKMEESLVFAITEGELKEFERFNTYQTHEVKDKFKLAAFIISLLIFSMTMLIMEKIDKNKFGYKTRFFGMFIIFTSFATAFNIMIVNYAPAIFENSNSFEKSKIYYIN